jgi:hypothetical protein
VHVHAAELGAAVQGRHGLAWIEQPVLVECRFHSMKGFELDRLELHAHRVDFLDADAVLAGDGAADVDRKLQDFRAERFGFSSSPG